SKGVMMSCHNGNGYASGLPRADVVKMGDFQVAMGGGVWVAVGDHRQEVILHIQLVTILRDACPLPDRRISFFAYLPGGLGVMARIYRARIEGLQKWRLTA
ncbi:MAG: hypothetical protein ACYDDO_01720, partial [Acidiferrobacterales bacterium]